MKNEKVILTKEQALGLLAVDDYDCVHSFVQGGPALIGADWSLPTVTDAMDEAKVIEISGPAAQSMRHGIAITEASSRVVYLETDPEKLKAFLETKEGLKK